MILREPMKMRVQTFSAWMVLTVAVQPSLRSQEKPQFSVEIAVEVVLAAKPTLGVTKIYDPVLVNKTPATLFVNQCKVTDDTLNTLIVTPSALQRWNPETRRWDTIAAQRPEYCTGNRFEQARLVRTAVAPGEKLKVMGDFAGARDPFSFGDRGRFVVFLRAPGDSSEIAISPEFQIDEQRNKTPVEDRK